MNARLEMTRDMIDVTSNNRPDTSWQFTDASGHLHQWYTYDGKPATRYQGGDHYLTPTLKWIYDGTSHYPDGSPYDYGHHECVRCGARVEPGYKADEVTRYMPGMMHFYIDGCEVSLEEFKRAVIGSGWSEDEIKLLG